MFPTAGASDRGTIKEYFDLLGCLTLRVMVCRECPWRGKATQEYPTHLFLVTGAQGNMEEVNANSFSLLS